MRVDFFHNLDVDAVTVAPYMGSDSVIPFLEYENKWVVLLALTSNKGAEDFQMLRTKDYGDHLFEQVIKTSRKWGSANNLMYVVGATRPEYIVNVRELVPAHFLLVPGIGAQGGSLEEVAGYGLNEQCGLLVNASRSVIYADITNKFDHTARQKALEIQQEMETYLKRKKLL